MREGTERTSEAKAPSGPILRRRDELDLPVRPSPTLLPEHALRLHLRVSLRVLELKLRKLHRAKEAQKAEQREVVPSEEVGVAAAAARARRSAVSSQPQRWSLVRRGREVLARNLMPGGRVD